MATIYKRYLKLNIDGSCVGLGRGESESNYFCTPKGSKVIGWAGVDGIHYCFVHGFGDMVFTVSPMNTPGNYVHPVARDFTDFLRLLLACGDAAALEQVYCWDQAQFDAFLQDNPLNGEQQVVLDAIREKLLLAPMEQPFLISRSCRPSLITVASNILKITMSGFLLSRRYSNGRFTLTATFWDIMDVKELARKYVSIGSLSGTMKSGISQRFTPAVKAWSWTFAYRFQLRASVPL